MHSQAAGLLKNDCKIPTSKIVNICHVLLTVTATNDRPFLLSERVPHIDKMTTV
jgi:hypothetical protein